MCRALLGGGVHKVLRGLVNFLLTSLYISRQFVILLPFRLCCKSYAGDKRERVFGGGCLCMSGKLKKNYQRKLCQIYKILLASSIWRE